MQQEKSRFIASMDQIQAEAAAGEMTLRRVFQILGEEGHAVLILFFCLPFLQPLPIPGLSTPLGILIILVAFHLFMQKAPWLPKRFEHLRISSEVAIKVSEVAEKLWGYVFKIVKPRWVIFHDSYFFRFLNLLVFIVSAILLSLPLPIPFSNTVPVISIVLCAVGYMEKDGVMIFLSYLWMGVVGFFFAGLTLGALSFFNN